MVDQLQSLDEYDAMSVVDICHAVVNWPEGSEDQQRAIAAIQARAPGIGHNKPPIEEELDEEVAPWLERQHRIIEVAGQAIIIDEESFAKTNDLAIQVKGLKEEINAARDTKLRPYLEACDLIHRQYDPLIRSLEAAYGNRQLGLNGMVNAYVRKRDEAAAEAQRAAAEEQRKREAEAAEARRKAEEARTAGKGTIGAELAASAAEDEAEAAARRAAAIRPAPLRSQLGSVGTTRSIAYDVVDLRAAIDWMIDQPLRNVLEAGIRKMIGSYLRQVGVAAVERGVTIPGVKSWIERGANIRR